MGKLVYDNPANAFEVDDRTLAHVRIVIMNKLRRSEPFMLELTMTDGSGRRSLWIHPAVPLQFRMLSPRRVPINRLWIDTLMEAASGPNGLFLTPEPDERRAGGEDGANAYATIDARSAASTGRPSARNSQPAAR